MEVLDGPKVLEVIEKSLKKKEDDEIHVCDDPIVTEEMSGGLLSSTAKVKALYKVNDNQEVIGKTFYFKFMPKRRIPATLVKERRMFEKEAVYYGQILPMMLDLACGKLTVPLPKCYFIESDGGSKFLVLDDLKEESYRSPDASMLSTGLDIRHCLLAIKALGRLHGLSVAVVKALPDNWRCIGEFQVLATESWFYEAEDGRMECPGKNWTKKAMENLVELSKSVDFPLMKVDRVKLENFVKDAWRICCQMVTTDDKINVLSHGDFYANNLMFKYENKDSEIPVDVKLIDLQLTRYCHPAVDILFFLHLCTRKSLRDECMDGLLEAYYETLEFTLKTLDISPPPFTLEEIKRDVYGKYKSFGVLCGAVSVPSLILTRSEFDDVFEDDCAERVRKSFADNTKFRLRMNELIEEVVGVIQ